jgi:hypothetical protein
MRTAPVDVLTQAEIVVETGAAITAAHESTEKPSTPKNLSADIEASKTAVSAKDWE